MAKPRPAREEDVRRRAEAVLVIQAIGALLLLPPLINLFNTRTLLFGVPLEVLYLFVVWLLLIGCSVIISLRMPKAPESVPVEDQSPAPERRSEGNGG